MKYTQYNAHIHQVVYDLSRKTPDLCGMRSCPTRNMYVFCLTLASPARVNRHVTGSQASLKLKPWLSSSSALGYFWINTLLFPHAFCMGIVGEYLSVWLHWLSPRTYLLGVSACKFSETATSIDIYSLGSKKTWSMLVGEHHLSLVS